MSNVMIYYRPINTANIRNPIEITIKSSWNNIVFLNHSAKLTFARPSPTSSVPQVGYNTLVYPSANKYVKIITVLLIPSIGASVNIGMINTAFAEALGIKNSIISTNTYRINTAKYGDIFDTEL